MPDNRLFNIALITSYPLKLSTGSGVVRMIVHYANALQQLGHHCTIFHPHFEASSYLNLAVQRLAFNKQLPENLKQVDLLLGSDFDGFTLKALPCPKFVLNAGILADIVQFETGQTKRILNHLAKRECQNVRQADLVIVPSQYTASKVKQYYSIKPEKIKIIPLAIDHAYWQRLQQNVTLKFKNFITILTVARQYPRKGIRDLLFAFQMVAQKEQNVQLVLIGGGPEWEANRFLANRLNIDNRVLFVGDLEDQQELARYYQQADIFCLPSYHETFGLVFLEAMFFGLPIVTYATTAIPEVVTEQQGFLIPPGDIDSLKEKLLILIQDKKLRQKLGHDGHQKVKNYHWQKSAQMLLEAYSQFH